MELFARLVHTEAGCRVVEVVAAQGERRLGSALGEAGSAEEAEERALRRLLARLQAPQDGSGGGLGPPPPRRISPSPSAPLEPTDPGQVGATPAGASERPAAASGLPILQVSASPVSEERRVGEDRSSAAAAAPGPLRRRGERTAQGPAPTPVEVAAEETDPGEEPPADPEDWSSELVAVDLQLRRLGWSREQEAAYLQRAFGHPSRARLTRYGDLCAYLTALEGLDPDADPAQAPVPLRRADLLVQGDALLAQLGWSAEEGRRVLEREMGRQSRRQLSDVQLLQFNMLLESELLQASPAGGAAVTLEAQR